MNFLNNILDRLPSSRHGRIIMRGSMIALIGVSLVQIIGFVQLWIKTRILSPNSVGLLALGFSVVPLFFVLNAGFQNAMLRYASFYRGQGSKEHVKGVVFATYKLAIPFLAASTLLLIVFSDTLAVRVFHRQELTILFRIFAVGAFFTGISGLNTSLLSSRYMIKYAYIFTITRHIILISLFLSFLFLGNFRIVWALASLVSAVLILAVSAVVLWRKIPFLFDKKIKPEIEKTNILKFSLFSSATRTLYKFRDEIRIFVMALFLNSSEIALFHVATHLSGICSLFLKALNRIFAPVAGNLYGKNKVKTIRRLHMKTMIALGALSAGVFCIYYFFGESILGLFGDYYKKALLPLLIMAFAGIIASLAGSVGMIINMMNRPHLNTINSFCTVFLMLFLANKLIPVYGIAGAAAASAASRIVINIVAFLEVMWLYRVEGAGKRSF